MPNNKPKILIIEDEPNLLDMYKLKFEDVGFDILIATTGEEGLQLVKDKEFDLIFVDLLLINKVEGGKIDGFEVIKKLRQNGTTSKAKIYALTNLDQEKDINKAYKAGVDGYIVKSDLTPSELVESAKRILEGKKINVSKP